PMSRTFVPWLVLLAVGSLLPAPGQPGRTARPSAPNGWTTAAPRDEIRPTFAFETAGGARGHGAWGIPGSRREAEAGWGKENCPGSGGKHYRFSAFYRAAGVALERRSVVARVLWKDDAGRGVPQDRATARTFAPPYGARAEAEHPATRGPTPQGWTEVSDVYRAPSKATRAAVELHLLWAPGGVVRWSGVAFEEAAAPRPRKVRLAAVHYVPRRGKTPADNRRQFVGLIEKAAAQKA